MIKVFHQPDTEELCFTFGRGEDAARHIANHFYQFHHVADVPTNNLEEAWQLTNSIDLPWWNDSSVKFHGSERHGKEGSRSSMVGDVFYCDVEDTFYYVASIGFQKIDVTALIRDALINGITLSNGTRCGGKVTAIKYKRTFSRAAGEGMALKEAKDWVEAYMDANGIS